MPHKLKIALQNLLNLFSNFQHSAYNLEEQKSYSIYMQIIHIDLFKFNDNHLKNPISLLDLG